MSAADIGRRKIEDRTAEYVTVGDRVLDDNGREYHVLRFWSGVDTVTLDLSPINQCGSKCFVFKRGESIRVRRKTKA